MSLKELFQTTVKNEKLTNEEINSDLRSDNFIEEQIENQTSFVPNIDFSNPANFAFFGSAEKYYSDAFDRILNLYPYDGSTSEKLKWRNESTLIDKWVFDNQYPKSTGYATFSANGWGTLVGSKVSGYGLPSSQEYIFVKGTLNTGSIQANSLKDSFDTSNKLDSTNNRLSNLYVNGSTGFTLEFWLNKNSFDTTKTEKEVIFDLWNNEDTSSVSYGRVTLALTSSGGFLLTVRSGSDGVNNLQLGSGLSVLGGWHHYAINVKNSDSSNLSVSLYRDSQVYQQTNSGTDIESLAGAITAHIGSLRTAIDGTSTAIGYGKLSASLDEFRFWKSSRTSQDIGRYWWTNVDGGSNTDDYATNLGVYYKFNEGIVGTTNRDQVVIDYSGRTTNGYWYGYTNTSRNTGSAINLYGSSFTEIGDPILYSTHTNVSNKLTELQASGSLHDLNNSTSLYKLIPSWITEEDEESGEQLNNLTQIICSYFDTVYLQVQSLTKLKDNLSTLSKVQGIIEGDSELNEVIGTFQTSNKPLPFAKTLLVSNGIITPELFADASILEKFLDRNEDINFESSLSDIKNNIYNNIYSSLINAFKTKGTKKSYKNILHSFGIDEKLVKINTYPSNTTYTFDNNTNNIAQKRKVINFNEADRYSATIHQYYDSSNSNTRSFITGSVVSSSITVECETIFPLKVFNDELFDDTPFTQTSVFGSHTNNGSNTNLSWATFDYFNFVVKANRNGAESKDAYFQLDSTLLTSPLTTPVFYDVYNNEKWNFIVRISPAKYENSSLITSLNSDYTIEFIGINSFGNTVQNSFTQSATISSIAAERAIQANKSLFVGAYRNNFTGSIINYADSKVSYLRFWTTKLTDETILQHSSDSYNYGTKNPANNSYLNSSNIIPEIDTLVLDWSFNQVTGSDGSGQFIVQDLTSGSINQNKGYDTWFNNISKYQYTGRGYNFLANDNSFVSNEYVVADKLKLPDTINSSDMINILTEDDELFTSDSRPEIYVTRFEKSMYQTISEEMINMFGTMVKFNDYVGRPVHKYRAEYKDLRYLRELFFAKVQNEPDLDKYLEFYKWFDDAVGVFLAQLTPATAQISSKLENTIESHILERQKYQHKYPKINSKAQDPEDGANGINAHLFNWKYGSRPINGSQTTNNLYWKELAERDSADVTRTAIHSASLQVLNRRFSTAYNFNAVQDKTLKGGVNFEQNKRLDFVKVVTAPHGALDETESSPGVFPPANVLFMGVENSSSTFFVPEDPVNPLKKRKYNFTTINVKDYQPNELLYTHRLDSTLVAPLNLISASVQGGYQTDVTNNFLSGVVITNIHNDTYGDSGEIPMQGPFTSQWVGGNQSRHIDLNTGNDSYLTRPEAWKIVYGAINLPDADGNPTQTEFQQAIGYVGADYPYPEGNDFLPSYPVVAHKRATYTREELAKRPVNIKNIQTLTSSAARIGNYTSNYEVVHTFGRTNNNRELIDAINPSIQTELSGVFRSNFNDGRVDFTLPTRQILKTVVGCRFSAPGGYRYSSRGYMNRYAEELSAYNAMSFRNRELIGVPHGVGSTPNVELVSGILGIGLLNHLTTHSERGYYGVSGVYETSASFHKTNKNTKYKVSAPEDAKDADLEPVYDNGFITHQIPQIDANYSWLRNSLVSGAVSGNIAYMGHDIGLTYPTGTRNSDTISYSTIQQGIIGLNSGAYGDVYYGDISGTSFIPVDFVGLHTVVKDELSGNFYPKTLGQPSLDNYLFDGLAINADIVSIEDTSINYVNSNKYPLNQVSENSFSSSFIGSNGTKLYALGRNTRALYEYNLTTAWDTNTATYVGKNKVISSSAIPETGSVGIYWKSDGTVLYLLGLQQSKIYALTASIAWDVTSLNTSTIANTCSLSQSALAGGSSFNETTSSQMYFTNDGLRMYVTNQSANLIHQFTQSGTPWNLSTYRYDGNLNINTATSGRPGGPISNVFDIQFVNNGKSFYISDLTGSSGVPQIYRFNIPNPLDAYNIKGTIVEDGAKNLLPTTTPSTQLKFQFKNDFTKLYVLNFNQITQYGLRSDYDYYARILNSILLNRNGTYGYPIFKQIRTGDAKSAKSMKALSLITNTKKVQTSANSHKENVFEDITNVYREPAVTVSRPIVAIITDTQTNTLIFIKHTDINNIINFANKQLNADLNLENYSSTNQPIDKLITLLSSPQNTRFKLKKLVISQDVYPKIENAGLIDSRNRALFSFPYNSDRFSRNTIDETPTFTEGTELQNINSLNYSGKSSLFTFPRSPAIHFSTKGDYVFFTDYTSSGTPSIKVRSLSTPWDITTVGPTNINSRRLISTEITSYVVTNNPQDIYIRDNGTDFYILAGTESNTTSSHTIQRVTFATPYNLASATTYNGIVKVTGSFPTASHQPQGFYFKPDGMRVYVVGSGSLGVIQQFNLTSSWSLPPAFSASQVTSSNIYAPDTNLSSISFTNDGRFCYLLGKTSKKIYEYRLSTSWDIQSCQLVGSKDISLQTFLLEPEGLYFKQDKRIPAIYVTTNGESTFQYDGPYTTATKPLLSQSVWPLDGAYPYNTSSNGLNSVVGILQNNNTYVSSSTALSLFANENYLYPSPLLANKLTSYSYYSAINPTLPSNAKYNVYYSASLDSDFAIVQTTLSSTLPSDRVLQPTQMFYNNTPWTAASLRGKGPYPNSYEDSSQYSKLKTLQHTLIPEFIVSSKVQDYLTRFNQSSTFIDENFLSITGTVLNSSTDLNFYEQYAHTNNIERIRDINNKITNSKLKTKKSIKLTFEGLLKFTPYEGFYPVQRTLDIVEQFNNSYGENIKYTSLAASASGTPSSGSEKFPSPVSFQESKQYGLRSILTPLFAPGLLYNTIKSGIAVDYPIITSSVSSSEFYLVSSSNISAQSYNRSSKTPLIANNNFNIRLPFETLIEPENYIKNLIFIDQVPSSSAYNMALNVSASWNGNGDFYYKYMINNFLAEIPNFFLQNEKLSALKSNVIIGNNITIKSQDVGKEFAAIVKLKKTINEQSRITADVINTLTDVTSINAATELLKDSYNYPRPQKFGEETITTYSNPSAFGPLCAGGINSGSALTNHYTFNKVDGTSGYNPSFTPPYYDGEAWLLLTYKPKQSGSFNLDQIINDISSSYLRYEFNQYAGLPIEQGFYTFDGIQSNSVGPLACFSSSTGIVDRLNANSMQLSASVFLKVDNIIPQLDSDRLAEGSSNLSIADRKQLVISTKFETPILDFNYGRMIDELSSSHISVMGAFEISGGSHISSSTGIPKDLGIWHQYGLLPRDNAGIYLTIEDMPDSYKAYGRKTGIVLTASAFTPNRDVSNTGSLLSLLGGFENTEVKLGTLADTKVIKEAIVAIPFTIIDGKRKYFELSEETVENYKSNKLSGISSSIVKQLNSMKEYIFPPQFDFLQNNVTPISMYVFEFIHKFSKQDLQDMWQNIMPELGEQDKWKIQTKTIKHEIKEGALLSDIDNIDNLRWLVFKVKKRAEGSYYHMIGKNFVNQAEWEDTSIPNYTYNWPYDFFTIIETGKLTAELEIEEEP
ncbi:MAG: Lentibacter virus vB LenP [Bacteroidota bacterium]|jgi:hypothetical protein